jgi:hypothetical protein
MSWEVTLCAASGPSLSAEQVEMACQAQLAGRCRIIAINNTWECFPGGDVLYAADGGWWDRYHLDVRTRFKGSLWTQDDRAAAKYELQHIKAIRGDRLPEEGDRICMGSNSGHQAIGLAHRLGARKIVLIGYDMQRTGGRMHWHGDHPLPLGNGDPKSWIPRFKPLADDLEAVGVRVINASLQTALPWFPRGDLAEALA